MEPKLRPILSKEETLQVNNITYHSQFCSLRILHVTSVIPLFLYLYRLGLSISLLDLMCWFSITYAIKFSLVLFSSWWTLHSTLLLLAYHLGIIFSWTLPISLLCSIIHRNVFQLRNVYTFIIAFISGQQPWQLRC